MTILEDVTNMRNQNIPDEQITQTLQEQGIPPKQITDALSQAQVKTAVTGQEPGMQPSIMPGAPQQEMSKQATNQIYTPQTQEIQEPEYTAPEAYSQDYAGQQAYYPQEQYSTATPSDTIIEIAEQIFDEKSSEITKQLESLNELKTIAKTKLEHLDQRMQKIEALIAKLQIEILKKVGSYSDDLTSIKKEMSMTQNSFAKLIGSAARKSKTPSTRKTSKRKKK